MLFTKHEISKGWKEMDSMPEEADPWVVAERCVAIKRGERLEKLVRENQEKMKEASARGEAITEYLRKHQDLLREKQQAIKAPVS